MNGMIRQTSFNKGFVLVTKILHNINREYWPNPKGESVPVIFKNKVKIELMLKGRENQQSAMAFEIIKSFVQQINEVEKIRSEQEVEKQGNKITTIIAKA
jgi:hypothetical protein